MIGIRTTGIHAPWLNFDTTTTMSTMNVAIAPTMLITWLRFQPGSWRRLWCTTMPSWESVNPQNTPTA